MKRSSRLMPLTIGLTVSAFALAACRPEVTEMDAQLFPDANACYAAADAGGSSILRSDCDTAATEAQAMHEANAPRYDALATCEAEYGAGNCTDTAQNSGGGMGSFFMPLLMGYMMGNMLSGGRNASQPIYSQASGGYTTSDRSSTFANNSGNTRVNAASFSNAASGQSARNTGNASARPAAAPMSQSTVRSTGGFGGSASSGGFGG
ncbi:DUF1190 domain-containing protein [Ketogulonicigenium vulgare]|uniref:DUF1190 domain-containing protein n=1 Tax=Ketogulonicigenium vulgare TaxID=92945 RepID=UPI0023595EEB|nr:DUF1190 domain-containing protein [Ketogulonicigenium vulgare]